MVVGASIFLVEAAPSLLVEADVVHSGTSDPNLIEYTMEQAGVDEVTNMETDASRPQE